MSDAKMPLCIGAVIFALAALLIMILVPMHFSYVNINEVGLKKGTTSGEVDTDTGYSTGRYGWGVTKTALNFKNTWREVRYTGSRAPRVANDGGEIIVGVTFFYYITVEGLGRTYEDFAAAYEPIVEKQSLDAIKNAAANFTTTQYQTQRSNVSNTMYEAVRSKLETLVHVAVPRAGFVLREIQLPQLVLNKRLDSFEQEQQQITQGFQLATQQYRLATQQNVSRIERSTDVIRSQSLVDAQGVRDQASNRARAARQAEEGRQLNAMVTALNLTSNVNGTRKLVRLNSMLDFDRPVTILQNVIGSVFV